MEQEPTLDTFEKNSTHAVHFRKSSHSVDSGHDMTNMTNNAVILENRKISIDQAMPICENLKCDKSINNNNNNYQNLCLDAPPMTTMVGGATTMNGYRSSQSDTGYGGSNCDLYRKM